MLTRLRSWKRTAFAVCAVIVAPSALAAAASAAGPTPAAVPMLLTVTRAVPAADLPERAMRGDPGHTGRFNDALLHSARMAVELPDGRTLQVQRRQETRGNRGERSWVGEVEGMPGSVASVTLHAGHASGFIHHGSETWELQPTGVAGTSRLFRVDVLKLPGEPALPVAPAPAGDALATAAGAAAPAVATAADPVVQDLLIVYTAAAAAANGGAAALESMALNAVAAANVAYGNSRVNIRLNVVGLRQVAYAETGDMGASLTRLQSPGDGHMDDVHTARNSTGADLVTLLTTDTNACGIGYVLGSTNGNPAYGFNVVAPRCLSNHSLAHEIGHNQGNQHDRPNGGTAFYPYAYGFRSCDHPTVAGGQSFRTVMGYPCGSVPRVNHFSNPQVYYNNAAPMGIAYEADPANAADNARSMNQTAAAVAAYRTPVAVATAPAAPGSMTVGLDAAGTTATLRWADNAGNEQGFVVQRSAAGGAFVDRATLGANATTFSDTGLAASTAYSWRVRAYNAAGASAYSNTVSLSTPAPAAVPAAPSGLTAALATSTSAALRWTDNATNEQGYVVQRSASGGAWADIATLAAGSTGFTDGALAASTAYAWRVRAVNATGASSYSNTAALTTPAAGVGGVAVPAAPTASGYLWSSGTALIRWSNVAGETGYVLQRSDNGGAFVDRARYGADSTTAADWVSPRTRYVWRVRAFNAVGASAYSNEVTLTTP